jgi:hypothetical protein
MNPAVMVWSLTSEDFYRKYIEEIAVPIAVAPQGQGRWAKLRWLRSLVNKARPAVLHSMAFFLNSGAAWATVVSPTIAIGAIRGDYRFEQRYGRMYYAVNRHSRGYHCKQRSCLAGRGSNGGWVAGGRQTLAIFGVLWRKV